MMGMGMMGMGSTLPIGAAFDILTVKLGKETTAKPSPGSAAGSVDALRPEQRP